MMSGMFLLLSGILVLGNGTNAPMLAPLLEPGGELTGLSSSLHPG